MRGIFDVAFGSFCLNEPEAAFPGFANLELNGASIIRCTLTWSNFNGVRFSQAAGCREIGKCKVVGNMTYNATTEGVSAEINGTIKIQFEISEWF